MIVAADERLHVSARHAVNSKKLVLAQFTAVTRLRAAACNLLYGVEINPRVLVFNIKCLKFVLHFYLSLCSLYLTISVTLC